MNNIKLLRIIGIVEGFSYLILLFVAMPLKYFYDDPSWVKYTGQIHGFLFVAYVFYCLKLGYEFGWKWISFTGLLLFASIIPFGTFYTDYKLLKPLK